jgi:F-type H+-transporting ATPase subunit beta
MAACRFAGVGEKTNLREGNDLYHEFLDGVIAKDADGNPTPEGPKVACWCSAEGSSCTSARALLARAVGLTQAEYFRDVEGQDVLFFSSTTSSVSRAGSEVSALLRLHPVGGGLSADAGDRHGAAAGADHPTNKRGRSPSVQAIYVPVLPTI